MGLENGMKERESERWLFALDKEGSVKAYTTDSKQLFQAFSGAHSCFNFKLQAQDTQARLQFKMKPFTFS